MSPSTRAPGAACLCFAAVTAAVATGCYTGPGSIFTRLTEARRLAAELRAQFNKEADASNRAVMADTDEASLAFAREAEGAMQAVQKDVDALRPLFRGLAYANESRLLDELSGHLARYRTIDRAVLELAVENSNLKAQQLSFGAAREAADAFRSALDAITRAAAAKSRCRIESLTAGAVVAVREIQVLHAPHIAEPKDAEMTRMEKEMTDRETAARGALRTLSDVVEPASREQLAAAVAALDRFHGIHTQIIALSRRNSNVRSLAMSLGEKRSLTSACEASIAALQEALMKEESSPSR